MNPFSQMQLRDYALIVLQVQANIGFDNTKDNKYEGQIGINFDFKKQEAAPVFRVDLQIDVNSSDKAFIHSPYRIKIEIQSFIEFEEGFPEDNIPSLLGPNGLAMTYSIARGIVGQATGTSLHGKFVLPTVNFVELLAKKYPSKKNIKRKVKKIFQ